MSRINYLQRPLEVKEAKADGTFVGYGSVFGELDSYRDIMMPGAFAKSLKRDFADKGRKVPMLRNHNSDNPIGVYKVIEEDTKGLYVEGEYNMDVQAARETLSLMKQGALTGLSIGYTTVESEMDSKSSHRKLIEVALWEVSPVTFPASDSSRASVKSFAELSSLSDWEDYLRDAYGASQKEAVALASRLKAIMAAQSDSDAGPDAAKLKRVKTIIDSLT